jgi:hypothetical protein
MGRRRVAWQGNHDVVAHELHLSIVHTNRSGADAASPDGKGADWQRWCWLLPMVTAVVVLLLPMAASVVASRQRCGGGGGGVTRRRQWW